MKFWKSKKFWVTLGTLGLAILNNKLGWGLSEETVTQIVGGGAAYNIGQGLADFGKHAK